MVYTLLRCVCVSLSLCVCVSRCVCVSVCVYVRVSLSVSVSVSLSVFVSGSFFLFSGYRHKLASWQGGFLLLCFSWTLLRVIYWFFAKNTWPVWLATFLYVVPSLCQCATFSLLILFYAQLVDPSQWPAKRSNYLTAYGMANFSMLVFSILYAGINNSQSSHNVSIEESKAFVDRVYFVVSAIYFGILVILAAYYLLRLHSMNSAAIRYAKPMVAFTALSFLIFLSRCIFDFLFAFNVLETMHSQTTSFSSAQKEIPVAAFLLFMLWEVLPTGMVLVYFRHIPSTEVAISLPRLFLSCLAGECCVRMRQTLCPCCDCCVSAQTNRQQRDDEEDNADDNGDDSVSPVMGTVKIYRTLPEMAPTPSTTTVAGSTTPRLSSYTDSQMFTAHSVPAHYSHVPPYANANVSAAYYPFHRSASLGGLGGLGFLDELSRQYVHGEAENWDRVAMPHSSSFPDPNDHTISGHPYSASLDSPPY